MQKSGLRLHKLVPYAGAQFDEQAEIIENEAVDERNIQIELTPVTLADGVAIATIVPDEQMVRGEVEARHLLKRTPGSYLLNQAYGLWVYISLFLLTLIVTRKLSVEQYSVYAVAMVAFNTIAYIVAFGLEDATTTFLPRVFAEHGRASAALLLRRLLLLRLLMLGLSMGIMFLGMPVLAYLFALIPWSYSQQIATQLRNPVLLNHIAPIAIFVLGNGIGGLFTAVCASLMRMKFVFVVGSLTQVAQLALGFVALKLGWGVDGVLWMLALISLFNAAAFVVWLAPFLFTRGAAYVQPLKPVVQLGIAAWQTNLVANALLKQVPIIILGYFAVSLTQIGYFNLSFQLAHAASLLFVSGFGGVGVAAMAAALVGMNYDRLARTWQTLIKIETILAAPGLVFCLFNAQIIAHALYGSNYDPVGPLLAIFLFFNILVRMLGTTIHQSTLYVLGRSGLVAISQWIGLAAVIILDVVLIPRWGPAGALVADGVAQLLIGAMLLSLLWPSLPRKYPLGFTLRFLLIIVIAALPGIVWRPTGRLLLGLSGVIFLVLCLGLSIVIKPLTAEDLEMVTQFNPWFTPFLKWFARKSPPG